MYKRNLRLKRNLIAAIVVFVGILFVIVTIRFAFPVAQFVWDNTP
jgi:preprotein translocase subunit SecF